jgi:hypothetical protein
VIPAGSYVLAVLALSDDDLLVVNIKVLNPQRATLHQQRRALQICEDEASLFYLEDDG